MKRSRLLMTSMGLLALGLAPLLIGCSSQPSAATGSGKLVLVSTGGTYARAIREAYIIPFERATGIQVQEVAGGDNPIPAIQAQIKSNNVLWDITVCSPQSETAFGDIWNPIDRSIVTASDFAVPNAVGKYRVLEHVEAFPVFGYSTKQYPTAPTSWADFYDAKKFPGPRGLPQQGLDSAWTLPVTALLADGVSPDTLAPFDLDRAYRKLDSIKSSIRAYYTGFSQGQDLLRSGEITMALMTDGRMLSLIDQGTKVGIVWNQAFSYRASWCTPKGAPDSKNAMLFYQYVLSHPDQQAVFSSITFYSPATTSGAASLKKLGIQDFGTLHVSQLIPDSPALVDYISSNSDALLKRWNAFSQG